VLDTESQNLIIKTLSPLYLQITSLKFIKICLKEIIKREGRGESERQTEKPRDIEKE
jgi:hypothetical protein